MGRHSHSTWPRQTDESSWATGTRATGAGCCSCTYNDRTLEYLDALRDFIGEPNATCRKLSTDASVTSHHVAEQNFSCCGCFGSAYFVHRPCKDYQGFGRQKLACCRRSKQG